MRGVIWSMSILEMCKQEREQKLQNLEAMLRQYGQNAYVAVAFSGGVDSTFLLSVAHDVCGSHACAIMVVSPFIPASEIEEARSLAREMGVHLIEVAVDVLEDPEIAENNDERCYVCKLKLFKEIVKTADAYALSRSICGCQAEKALVVDGTNKDDEHDYRPGMKALTELGVKSPLREVGLTKEDIRALSRQRGLITWDKPAYACLATRIPTHSKITEDKLRTIEQAEDVLHEWGFHHVRVRHHGDIARIELDETDIPQFMAGDTRTAIAEALKHLGLTYITLDIEGYKRGQTR